MAEKEIFLGVTVTKLGQIVMLWGRPKKKKRKEKTP